MKILITLTLALSTLAFNSVQAEEYDEGVEYIALSQAVPTKNPDKVEVREIFWYRCPHCYNLEPLVKNWKKTKPDNVDFIQYPVMFSKRTEMGAIQYFTLETLGLVDALHERLFVAIHVQNRTFNKNSFAKWVAQLSTYEEADVIKVINSFAMRMNINKATINSKKYNANSVPMFVVNGKYITNGTIAGSNRELFKVVDFLVAKESK